MSFLTKREKFANSQRQKNRDQIFQKFRSTYAQPQPITSSFSTDYYVLSKQSFHNQNISNNHYESLQKRSQFVFEQEFLYIGSTPEQIKYALQNQQIEKILQPMPKWVACLGQSESDLSENTCQILNNLLNLAKYCFEQQLLLQQITNCVVELTGLPTKILNKIYISEQQISSWLVKKCLQVVKNSTNMQLIFNCTYICGNLYKSYMSARKVQMEEMVNQSEVTMLIVTKMEEICMLYPGYSTCLQVLLWYMKNTIIVTNNLATPLLKTSKLGNEQSQCAYQSYFVHVIQRIVVTICCKIGDQNSVLLMDKNQFTYYQKILQSSFSVLLLLVCNPDAYLRKLFVSNLQSIDNAINTFLATLPPNPTPLSSSQLQTTSLICQILSQILLHMSSNKSMISMLPRSIVSVCIMTAEGRLKFAQSFQLCGAMLEVSLHSGGIGKFNQIFIATFMQNIDTIYGRQEIVTDRSYRVSALSLFDTIQQYFSRHQLQTIMTHPSQQQKNPVITPQPPMPGPPNKAPTRRLEQSLPIILNIIELMLIDEDSWNRAMGIKIIYKLTAYWQLQIEQVKNLIISMGLHTRIIQMQEEKEELVYNAALDLIEELGLDSEADCL